jgi:hypothetical protein
MVHLRLDFNRLGPPAGLVVSELAGDPDYELPRSSD